MTLHIVKVFFASPYWKMWKFSYLKGDTEQHSLSYRYVRTGTFYVPRYPISIRVWGIVSFISDRVFPQPSNRWTKVSSTLSLYIWQSSLGAGERKGPPKMYRDFSTSSFCEQFKFVIPPTWSRGRYCLSSSFTGKIHKYTQLSIGWYRETKSVLAGHQLLLTK
mgnify:CR=1 FL=1